LLAADSHARLPQPTEARPTAPIHSTISVGKHSYNPASPDAQGQSRFSMNLVTLCKPALKTSPNSSLKGLDVRTTGGMWATEAQQDPVPSWVEGTC